MKFIKFQNWISFILICQNKLQYCNYYLVFSLETPNLVIITMLWDWRWAKDALFFTWMIIWSLWLFERGSFLWQPMKIKYYSHEIFDVAKWGIHDFYDNIMIDFAITMKTDSISSNWLWLLSTGCFKAKLKYVYFCFQGSFHKIV